MSSQIIKNKTEQKLREKLQKNSIQFLSNTELLALILGQGSKIENTLKFAQQILQKIPFQKLKLASLQDLIKVDINIIYASQIVSAFELSRRLEKERNKLVYTTPKIIWQELKSIRDRKEKYFVMFYLDLNNEELRREIMDVSELNLKLISFRDFFEPAIKTNAQKIVVAYSNISRNLKLIDDDIIFFEQLKKAGDILSLEVLDYIVIAGENFVSLGSDKRDKMK